MRIIKVLPVIFLLFLCFSGKKAAAQIQFTAAVDSGCAPLNVQFTSSLTVPHYRWDFGDGITSILQNPSHVYMNPGSYTVKLHVTGPSGFSDSLIRTNYITVLGDPVANFQVMNPSVCENSAVVGFTNTSQNSTMYIWDFGDGTISTQANPTHLYSNNGNYTVQLIAKNSLGCNDIKVLNNAVHVIPQPDIDFVASSTSLCLPQSQTTFTNLTSGCTWQKWDFGDGSTSLLANPSHSYTMAGSYHVTLIARNANGCEDTLTKNSYISVVPMASPPITTNVTTGCPPVTVNFSTSTANSYLWDFGNGITSTSANPSYTYSSSGLYDVSLTITRPNGCVETTLANDLINIPQSATALFSVDDASGCAPLVCNFTNLSQNAATFNWIFGDGQYSTLHNPTHTYLNNGNYLTTLHAINSAGCITVYTYTAGVHSSKPHADFTTPSQVNCSPFTVPFTNTSNAGAVSYLWDFGDGATSTQANPTHTYTSPGNFNVQLIAINANGCRDTLKRVNYLTVINPTVNYSSVDTLTGCAPYTISMNDSTFGANSWLWNFGDGTQSTLRNPTHTYTQSGVYTVTLNIGLNGGCTQFYSSFKQVKVSTVNAGFTYTYNCHTRTVTFADTTANVISNLWNFHDGSNSTQLNPAHTYAATGVFNLTLTVTNAQGCSETMSFVNLLDIQACPGGGLSGGGLIPPAAGEPHSGGSTPTTPPAGSNQIDGCIPMSVHFTYPFSSGGPIAWIFGDNSTSTANNPGHTYSIPGVYTVLLVYENIYGATDTIRYTDLISVAGAQAHFTASLHSDCIQYSVSTSNTSTNANQYVWSFGDSTVSSAVNPTHVYQGDQIDYTISLHAIDTVSGCSSHQSSTLFLSNNNMIWADKYVACTQGPVSFYFSSASYTGYAWDFGDGGTSNLQNPMHMYTHAGSYIVKLTVTDGFGCSRLFNLPQNITVYEPVADFNYVRSGSCSRYEMNFINLSTPLNLGPTGHCQWSFGDGTTSAQYLPTVSHIYTYPGTYQVTLNIKTNGGCTATITKTVVVNLLQADFSMHQNRDCFPMTVSFVDSTANGISWDWNFGNGITSTLQNPSVPYTQLPVDSIRLIVTDYRGCKDTLYKKDFNFFSNEVQLSADSACVNSGVTFSSQQDSVSLSWSFGDGATSSLLNPIHTYTSVNIFPVQMISTDMNGCRDTANTNVYTSTTVPGFSTSDTIGCAPHFVHFTNSSTGGQSYAWDFGDGSGSTNASPSHIYNTPGLYTVKLIAFNSLGCSDTMIINNYIKIIGPVVSFTLQNDTLCNPMSIGLQIHSSDVASWQWNFGDGANSSDTLPTHTYTQAGNYLISVIAHDIHGCSTFFADSSLFVSATPVAHYTVDTLARCAPASVHFDNYSTDATQYMWNFGNSSTATTSQAPVPVYSQPGTYTTSLIVKNNAGCADTAQVILHVFQKPDASFHASTTSMCPGTVFQLINTSTDTIHSSCSWVIAPGLTSSSCNPSLTMNSSGAHTVSLIVTNDNGCSDTLTKQNYITIADSMAPAINPIRVVSVSSDTTISVKWAQAGCTDFYAYVLFRKNSSSGNFVSIDTITDINITSFTDTGLNTLRYSYLYKLQTIDICGNKKELNELPAHRSIEITAYLLQDNSIQVNWNAYEGCGVSGYKIERADNGSAFSELATVPVVQTWYVDSMAWCPIRFIYRITAIGVCAGTEVSLSDTSAAKPANIFKNQKVDIIRSTVINNSSVYTEWAPPAIFPSAVASYKIFRKVNNQGYTLIATVPAGQNSFTDDEVDVNASVYLYKILIVNHCNLTSGEGQKGVSVLLEAKQNEFSTDLKWSTYSEWDSGVDYYIIERKNANGEWEQIKTTDGNTTTTTIEGE
ncbi:MAG: domain containing protein [Bacteroidetes bacterium]|jgi:PKD repeat protein|nr:domain containing protein [Bacteroidota bacterium]